MNVRALVGAIVLAVGPASLRWQGLECEGEFFYNLHGVRTVQLNVDACGIPQRAVDAGEAHVWVDGQDVGVTTRSDAWRRTSWRVYF